jgi:hypothetical protein
VYPVGRVKSAKEVSGLIVHCLTTKENHLQEQDATSYLIDFQFHHLSLTHGLCRFEALALLVCNFLMFDTDDGSENATKQ